MNILKHIKLYPVNQFSKIFALSVVLFLTALSTGKATHVVGGDISYKCLGFGDYEVTLTVRRDCQNGEEPFDAQAHIGIFDGYGNLLPWFGTGGMIIIDEFTVDTINTDLDQGCAFIGDPVCVTEATYVGVVNLPKRATGYYFAYQRCCRNSTLSNIIEPLNTGSTYWIRLKEEAMGEGCNSSPVFNQWPDVYICTNQTLVFDHSATDPEGDSLVYKLCPPSLGATFDLPQPVPPSGPPFEDVVYQTPFSFDNPMDGTPLTIDPNTGVITAVPNSIGQWLVGVCVEEYRNGELLSTLRRDFEYNTRICTEGPMASFDVTNPFCDGLEFTVNNTSTDADSYVWSVDPSMGVTFDNMAINPTFTFPENGIYKITVEAFRNIDGCSTVFSEDVGVYDSQLEASFDANIDGCTTDSTVVNLISTSTDPDYDIVSWDWTANVGSFSATAAGEITQITVPINDNVEITLIVTSENGCSESITQTFDADPLDLELIANPMSICQGDTLQILVNPNCDLTYTIEPLDYVIFDDPTDPCIISIAPQDSIVYTVTATDGICTATAEFMADVIEKSILSIDGDSISCDGFVKLWVNGVLPGNQFDWSTDPDFNNIIGDMTDTLVYEMQGDQETIYVRVKMGTGCSDQVSFNIYEESLDVSYPETVEICTDTDEEIVITSNDPDHTIVVTWEDNDIIISTTDSSATLNTSNPDLNTTIYFTVENQFGCILEDSINVTSFPKPNLDFDWEVTCGSLEMCFTNLTDPSDNDYFWDFGDLTTEADTSLEVNPCYTYPEPGMYDVTLYINSGPCEGDSITKTIEVPVIPEIEIENDDIFLCFGGKATLNANTNVDGDIVWTNNNGDTLGTGESIEIMGMETMVVTATLTDAFGCTSSDDVNVDVYIFDLVLDVPEIACVDEVVTVTLTNNSEGDDFTYDWSPDDCIISGDGTTTVEISASDTKEFTVNVINNENNCDTTLMFTLNISVIDKTIMADPEEPYQCEEVEVFVTPDNDECTYLWETGETTSSIIDTILENTTYTVTITDDNGCTLVQSIDVNVILPQCDETDVFLPDAFSPNNDGVNDQFIVRSNFVKEMELIIYDRWGEELFRSVDKNIGWDGTYKGEELAPNVYAYCLVATCSNGAEYKKTGNVTIVK